MSVDNLIRNIGLQRQLNANSDVKDEGLEITYGSNVYIQYLSPASNAYLQSVLTATSGASNAYLQHYVDTEISGLINGAPVALDTLNELAAALNDDPNAISALTTTVDTKASNTYVNTQLDLKATNSHVNTIDLTKAANTFVNTQLLLKASNTYVNAQLDTKASNTYVNTELGAKATNTYVNTQLADKATNTYVNTQLSARPSNTYVATVDATKATNTYVNAELALRVSNAYYQAQLAAAAVSNTYLQTELDLKATNTYVNTELLAKASNSYVNTQLLTKVNTADYTDAAVLAKVINVDGHTSGLDADTVDGVEGASLLRSDASDSYTSGTLEFDSGTTLQLNNGATAYFNANSTNVPMVVTSSVVVANLNADKLDGLHATNLASNTYMRSYVDASVNNLVNSAPSTLDTLNELAAALGDDANFSTTVTNTLATKASNTYVNAQVANLISTTTSNTYIQSALDLKATNTYVNTELAAKATNTYVNTELATKASNAYVVGTFGSNAYLQTIIPQQFQIVKNSYTNTTSLTYTVDTLNGVSHEVYFNGLKLGSGLFSTSANVLTLDASVQPVVDDTVEIIEYVGSPTLISPTAVSNTYAQVRFVASDAADTKTAGDLAFSDNVKLTFGDSADLEIFHDGANNNISNTSGPLIINGYLSLADLKAEVAASADFAAFKSRIAAL